jgi:hypothetical protein
MNRSPAQRLGPVLLPLLLSACGWFSGGNAQLLDNRLQARLTPEVADGRATVTSLPNGVQVTLTDQSLFPNGGAQLNDKGRYVLASVIEGLLAPHILRIDLAQSAATPPDLQQARLQAVRQFFEDYQLGSPLQPAGAQPGAPIAAASGGTTITVTIVSG